MRRVALLAVTLAVLAAAPLLFAPVAYADGGATVTATPVPSLDYSQFLAEESGTAPEPSLTSVLVGVLWKLGLVVLLAYGALWLMKRFSVRRVTSGGQQLQVLETVGLGANRNLHIVRVGPQILLIGSTPQELRTLADVSGSYDSDEPWADGAATEEAGDIQAVHSSTEPRLTPSLEAVERIRHLWGKGQS